MRKREAGQAIILVLVALSIVLLGAIGLAIDGSQIFAQRRMAQTAADAAAQAGIMSMFNGTNHGAGVSNPFGPDPFTCTAGTDGRTPCVYARMNSFGQTADDNIYVEFPDSEPGVNLSTQDPNALIKVTITRTLHTSFMQLLGTSTATVKAVAVAAIVNTISPVPILILHPDLPDAYQGKGNYTIKICGGPEMSIQVNSSSPSSISVNGVSGVVDLSQAGPDNTSPTSCDGSGAQFGAFRGPGTFPGSIQFGTSGHYNQPDSLIEDPLWWVEPPPVPPPHRVYPTFADGTGATVPGGTAGCPTGATCTLYSPGLYTGGITIKNETALFRPGIYYIQGGGFHLQANGSAVMATGSYSSDPTTGTGWTEGMLVYNTGANSNDIFEFAANSGSTTWGTNLQGSPNDSPYAGILFFEDRNVDALLQHDLQGGGAVTLRGTIYLHTSYDIISDTKYQKLMLGGNPGSSTEIWGMIIVDTLYLHGNPTITMHIDPTQEPNRRKVALVR